MSDADQPQQPRRPGHGPELQRVLALKILSGHLHNRHQLMNPRLADLRELPAAEAALLIRAMAAAAHADGEVDVRERRIIGDALASIEADGDEGQWIETELAEPPCLEALIRQIDSPRSAQRFYAVSLRVLDYNSKVNLAYLRYLGQRLALPGDIVVRLNRRYGLRA